MSLQEYEQTEIEEKAEMLIESEDQLAYDIAAEHGQIFDNIKDMPWFLQTVVEALESSDASLSALSSGGSLFDNPEEILEEST